MIAEGELTIGYLIYAAVCGLTAVFMARRKNRGAGLWFILGGLLGIFGLIILGFLDDEGLYDSVRIKQSAAYTSRHVQVVQTARGRYTKTPGLLATTSGQLEIVQVDGEPFAGRQPLMPKEGQPRAYRPAQPTQGELIAGPATIDGVPAGDLLLVGLDQWDLEEDKRTTLRHDIMQLGRAAYALTGRATIPEDVGARWLTGQEHATETAKRRWWDTLAAMRWLTVRVNPKTHRWLGMFDVDPRTSGAVWIGPPAWWRESRAESGPRSWRLSGCQGPCPIRSWPVDGLGAVGVPGRRRGHGSESSQTHQLMSETTTRQTTGLGWLMGMTAVMA